jgi:DNA processing protein
MSSAGAPGLDRAELAARLGLLAAPGLPPGVVLELLQKYRSGLAAYDQLARECGAELAAAARSEAVRRRVRRALGAIERSGIDVVAHDDRRYPRILHKRLDRFAPPLLFTRGDIRLLADTERCIAVVGSRRATQYGLDTAAELGAGIARAGGCVISGVARGIDAAAQSGALDAGGPSVGVLGCGVDVYYPRENTRLQDRLAVEGALISELLPGEPPRRFHFPYRNRIIAALSETVVVVEARERSGAVTTADHAADLGMTVYGVPNALDAPNAQGVLALLRDGARHYYGVREFLEEIGLLQFNAPLPLRAPRASSPDQSALSPTRSLASEHAAGGTLAETTPATAPADEVQRRVWERLGSRPQRVDRLAAATALPVPQLLTVLLQLELDGCVRQTAGQQYVRIPPRS